MRKLWLIVVVGTLTFSPAQAHQSDKPITDTDPDMVDVAKTPTTDLNITKEEIPPVLIAAIQKPYDLAGLDRCKPLMDAVGQLNAVLGPDLDLPQDARERISAGRVAKWVVTSFIPFRGLIRELSGANAQERAVQAAIQAGLTRRGFLKGIGAARRCGYPASPATQRDIDAYVAEIKAAEGKESDDKSDTKETARERTSAQEETSAGVPMVSQPVVQPTP